MDVIHREKKSVFLECACKKSLYYFLLSGLLFNTMSKLFNLLIPALEWKFGNYPFLKK